MDSSLQIVILLLCSLLSAISATCGQCQRCSSITTNSSAICKCDEQCHLFQDCCCETSMSAQAPPTLSTQGVEFECVSGFLSSDIVVEAENEAFLMITSCPEHGVDMTSEWLCVNSSTSLPPVTDLNTGFVYRNEHCALCNNATEIIAWSYQLICTQYLQDLITTNTLSAVLMQNPDLLDDECNVCAFIPPNSANISSPRSCVPSNRTCLPLDILSMLQKISVEEYDQKEEQCQSGLQDLVRMSDGAVFYNRACAECNGLFAKTLQCFSLISRKLNDTCVGISNFETLGPTTTFTIPLTLRSLGNKKVHISSRNDERDVPVPCPEGKVLVGVECLPTLCPAGYSQIGGRCSLINEDRVINNNTLTLHNCSNPQLISDNGTYTDFLNGTIALMETGLTLEVLDYDEFGHPIICDTSNITRVFLNCTSTFVSLNQSQFEDLQNGSIIFQNATFNVIYNDTEDGKPLICADLISSTKNTTEYYNNTNDAMGQLLFILELPGIQELTYIGSALSFLGCAAVIFTYTIFKELRTLPGVILMNLCAAMLGLNALFLVGGPISHYQHLIGVCSTLAILLHYSYLAQFSWMSVFSFEIAKTFYRAINRLYKSKKYKLRLLITYLFLGWLVPLVIIIIVIALNYSTILIQYGVDSQGELAGCWINHYYSLVVVFIVPLALCLAFNLTCFIFTSLFLYKAYKTSSKYGNNSQGAVVIRIWLALFTVTGLTWVFGFLALHKEIYWMWYAFTIFNSTPGFFIFLNFLLTNRIRNFYWTEMKKLKEKLSIKRIFKERKATIIMSQPKVPDNPKTGTISFNL